MLLFWLHLILILGYHEKMKDLSSIIESFLFVFRNAHAGYSYSLTSTNLSPDGTGHIVYLYINGNPADEDKFVSHYPVGNVFYDMKRKSFRYARIGKDIEIKRSEVIDPGYFHPMCKDFTEHPQFRTEMIKPMALNEEELIMVIIKFFMDCLSRALSDKIQKERKERIELNNYFVDLNGHEFHAYLFDNNFLLDMAKRGWDFDGVLDRKLTDTLKSLRDSKQFRDLWLLLGKDCKMCMSCGRPTEWINNRYCMCKTCHKNKRLYFRIRRNRSRERTVEVLKQLAEQYKKFYDRYGHDAYEIFKERYSIYYKKKGRPFATITRSS